MKGRDPQLLVSESDDKFHSPTNDSPSWIETLWFPFWVEEAGLSIAIRLWFAPNLGQQGGSLAAWKNNREILFGDRWTEDFTAEPDLAALQLEHGVSVDCLEPLSRYRVRYQRNDVDIDITFDALMPPNPVDPKESQGMFLGHFEQPGRVTGTVRHVDNSYRIDCYSIRDRSWGPRSMPEGLRLGNAYGADEHMAFFAYVNPDPEGNELITSGYLLKGGESAVITGGLRKTTWENDVPVAVALQFEDALGRRLSAEGVCKNAMASNAGNGVYGVLNLVQWQCAEGQLWGENHDIWSEADWLASGRSKL